MNNKYIYMVCGVARIGLKILGIKIISYDYVLNRLIFFYNAMKIKNKNNKINVIKRKALAPPRL